MADERKHQKQALFWFTLAVLFGASFRANGNLLSQWRGYAVHGKGVSIGFNPREIVRCVTLPEREETLP